MALALATGIPASTWAAEGDRAIATAHELLDQAQRKQQQPDNDARVMGG